MTRKRGREIRYRVSPNLVAHWRGGSLVVVNFATKMEVRAVPLVAQVLSTLGDWRTAADLARVLDQPGTERALQPLVDALVEASIVHQDNVAPDPSEALAQSWGTWNPAAGYFHAMTTGVTYLENNLPDRASAVVPCDRPVVSRPGRLTSLRQPDTSDQFPTVLLNRRTWRSLAKGSVPLQQVSALLWLTFGVQAWLHTDRGERLALKTSPSGGARHPIEALVFAKHVKGLRSGLYRYDAVRHALISVGPPPTRVRDYLPRQYWYERAALTVFLAARFGETRARYNYPRAYRAVLIEAGHLSQTFCLTATWLGLAPFCTLALDDRRINTDFGLDGVSRAVVYAAGIGRCSDAAVPSAVEGVEGVRITRRAARGGRHAVARKGHGRQR
jgi:SagB-type dehydrogenase family enzyme